MVLGTMVPGRVGRRRFRIELRPPEREASSRFGAGDVWSEANGSGSLQFSVVKRPWSLVDTLVMRFAAALFIVVFAGACSGDSGELSQVAAPSTTLVALESTTSIPSSTTSQTNMTSTTSAPARIVAEPATAETPDSVQAEIDDSDGVETIAVLTDEDLAGFGPLAFTASFTREELAPEVLREVRDGYGVPNLEVLPDSHDDEVIRCEAEVVINWLTDENLEELYGEPFPESSALHVMNSAELDEFELYVTDLVSCFETTRAWADAFFPRSVAEDVEQCFADNISFERLGGWERQIAEGSESENIASDEFELLLADCGFEG